MPNQHHHGRHLLSELCDVFQDWKTETGVSVAICENDCCYVAPSCPPNYHVSPSDVFVFDRHDIIVSRPQAPQLKLDTRTPIFLSALRLFGAEACLYTHSSEAAQVSMMFENEFRLSNVQLGATWKDMHPRQSQGSTVVIPIVDFAYDAQEVTDATIARLMQSEDIQAIILRGRGIFVWEDSWLKAKMAMELVHYLMKLAIQMSTMQVPLVRRQSSLTINRNYSRST